MDSVRQACILPDDNREKFVILKESILNSEMVDVKTMQRFAGKCISMGLAVPGAKWFCREVNAAISSSLKGSKHVSLSGNPRTEEVEYWRFLDS